MEITSHINKGVKLELLGRTCAESEKCLWDLLSYSNEEVPIFFAGVKENKFERAKQNNFVIPLKDRSLYLQFEVNNKTKKVYFVNCFESINPKWKVLFSIKDIGFIQGRQIKDNGEFYSKLVARINDTIDISNDNLGDNEIFQIWTNYLLTEEKIINRLNLTKKPYRIKKIVSSIPDNFIVELDRNFKLEQGAGGSISLNFFKGNTKGKGSLELIEILPKSRVRLVAKNLDIKNITIDHLLVPNYVGNLIEIKRKKQALEHLFKGAAANKNLKNIITNPESVDTPLERGFVPSWFKKDLSNDSQEVIQRILGGNDFYLVQGPPGTGKTTLITEVCQQLVSQNKTVLVASQGNLAVDNVAERVFPDSDLKALRLGRLESVTIEGARNSHPEVLSKKLISETISNINQSLTKLTNIVSLNYTESDLNELIRLMGFQKQVASLSYEIVEQNKVRKNLEDKRDTLLKQKSYYFDSKDSFESLPDDDLYLKCLDYYNKYEIDAERFSEIIKCFKSLTRHQSKLSNQKQRLKTLQKKAAELDQTYKDVRELKVKLLDAQKRKGSWLGGFVNLFFLSPESISKVISEKNNFISKNGNVKGLINEEDKLILEEKSKVEKIKALKIKLVPTGAESETVELLSHLEKYKLALEFITGSNFTFFKSILVIERGQSISQVVKLARNVFRNKQSLDIDIKRYNEEQIKLQREISTANKKEVGLRNSLGDIFKNEDLKEVKDCQIQKLTNRLKEQSFQEDLKQSIKPLENLKKNLFSESSLDKKILEDFLNNRCQVAMTTCSSSASGVLEKFENNFDYVIIDETSKALPTELLIPLLKGKSIILVGDHKQLPPFVEESTLAEFVDGDKEFIKQSLFERLFERATSARKTLMKTQYRMPPNLAQIVSEEFYEGEIISGDNVYQGAVIGNLKNNLCFVEVKSGESRNLNGSKFNEVEASSIETFLSKQQAEFKREKLSVGVITMYRGQKQKLDFLTKKFLDLDIEVGTVDSFQGREKDVIILSTVATNGSLGFLNDPRRINVAISRARMGLIIFGNRNTLEKNKHLKNILCSFNEIKQAA